MANLLDRASVFLTPTAYNNGEALCIKPDDASGDFQFSRNSAATRVNAQGLVENVQILSSNLVQNGDFSQQGVEEVSNGSFSQEGSELIVNGDFLVSTGWQGLNADRVISNGKLNISQASGFGVVYQPETLTVGTYYKCVVEVSNYVDGSFQIALAGSDSANSSASINSDGTHTFYLERLSGGSNNVGFIFDGLANLSINNVSVREVGQNWNLGAGFSIGENKLIGTNANSSTYQGVGIQANKTYKIQFTVLDYVSGNVRPLLNGAPNVDGTNVSANGTYTQYLKSTSNSNGNFSVRGIFFNGSITNISVKEVGQNWNLGTGWSIGNSVAISDGVSADSNLNTNNIGYSVGDLLKVSFSVSNVTSGTLQIVLGATQTYSSITNGDYEFITTATRPDGKVFFKSILFDGSITNISVVEITTDTNLPRINYEGFSYDGSGNIIPNSGCGSWLFEPQSTNLITYSETLGNNTTSGGISFTYNNSISPDGTQNAALVSVTNANDRLQPSFAAVNSLVAISIFLKHNGTDFSTQINTFNTGTGTLFGAIANVTASNVTFTSYQGGFDSASFVDYGNGWFRVIVVCQSTTGTTFAQWRPTTVSVALSYPCFGFQVEQQSYATSYIPTAGSTVTRNQDLCTNGGSLATINSTEGTLYAEIASLSNQVTSNYISLSDGTYNNRLSILYSTGTNIIRAFLRLGGASQADMTFVVSDITEFHKVAFKFKENDFALWIDGVEVRTDANGSTLPSGTLTKLAFSEINTTGGAFRGKTKALAVWKEALTDAELTALTTI